MSGAALSAAEIALRVGVGVVLVAVNAFFVSVEFALTRLRQYDRSDIAEELERHAGLSRAWEMTDKLEIYLTGCQLGITLSTILMGVVTEPAVTAMLKPVAALVGLEGQNLSVASVVVAIFIINLIHKIWGEQAPTYLGVERPLEVARYSAPILYGWSRVMSPLIYLGDGAAKLTLRAFGVEMTRSWTEEGGDASGDDDDDPMEARMARLLARAGVSEPRREEVLKALEIGTLDVRAIMIPEEEVIALSTARGFEENLERVRAHGFNRYPVVDGEGEVLGTLYLPRLVQRLEVLSRGEVKLREVVEEPLWVDGGLSVAAAIDRFQGARQELAYVEDPERAGRFQGILTATDAFEATFGPLEDPLDAPSP